MIFIRNRMITEIDYTQSEDELVSVAGYSVKNNIITDLISGISHNLYTEHKPVSVIVHGTKYLYITYDNGKYIVYRLDGYLIDTHLHENMTLMHYYVYLVYTEKLGQDLSILMRNKYQGTDKNYNIENFYLNCRQLLGVTNSGKAMYIDNNGEYQGPGKKSIVQIRNVMVIQKVPILLIYDFGTKECFFKMISDQDMLILDLENIESITVYKEYCEISSSDGDYTYNGLIKAPIGCPAQGYIKPKYGKKAPI